MGATAAVLLQFKEPLHRIFSRIDENDLKAILQFVVNSLLILPVLINGTNGPHSILNLHNIWLMVVLVGGLLVLWLWPPTCSSSHT